MKKLFFFFSIFFYGRLAAQIIIPGATQQPRWVFPIYIEDAIGQKDTVYYGYDSTAVYGVWPSDTIFGEVPEPNDTVSIQAFTQTFGTNRYNVEIRDSAFFSNSFGLFIGNVYPPVKLKWVVNLLRSDSLPFPDQDPLPRGQIWVDWYYTNNLPPCPGLGGGMFILLSDTGSALCTFEDSMAIDNLFPGPKGVSVILFLVPWTGTTPLNIKSYIEEQKITVTPQPAHEYIAIKCKEELHIEEIEILNLLGNSIMKFQTDIYRPLHLPVKSLKRDIYILKVKCKNEFIYTKIILI